MRSSSSARSAAPSSLKAIRGRGLADKAVKGKERKIPILLVQWADSYSDPQGWHKAGAYEYGPMICQTVGLLHSIEEGNLVLAQSYCNENNHVDAVWVVPLPMVKKVDVVGYFTC